MKNLSGRVQLEGRSPRLRVLRNFSFQPRHHYICYAELQYQESSLFNACELHHEIILERHQMRESANFV